MTPASRYPRLGLLLVIGACVLWTAVSPRLELPALRELFRLGELVGITPTAAGGKGQLGGQILGFNYSRPPNWYGFTARTLARLLSYAPALLPALWLRRRLASPSMWVATPAPRRVIRTSACLLGFASAYTLLSIALHDRLWIGLVRAFERLGASATWVSGLLAMTARGPFHGDRPIDALGNFVARHGPGMVFAGCAAALAAVLHARLWRNDLRRAAAAGLCRACGYDLRGTPGGSRCPECGASTRPPNILAGDAHA